MMEKSSVLLVQEELQALLRPYKGDLARRKRLAETLEQILKTMAKDDFLALDEALSSATASELEQEPGLEDAKDCLDKLRADVKERVELYRLEFIEDLTARAEQAGLPLEIDFPRFSSMKGIEGEVDFANRKTVLNKKILKSIDPRRILNALQQLKRKLYDAPFNPQSFIDGLFAAYKALCKRQGHGKGHVVPLQAFYLEYVLSLQSKTFFGDMEKGKFKGYAAEQFAVDLWRYYQAGLSGGKGKPALRLDPGRSGGLWLFDSTGERRHFTGISFQE